MAEGVETFRVQPGQLIGKDGLVRMLAGWTQSPGTDDGASTSSVYLKPGEAQAFLKGEGELGAQWMVRLASLKDGVLESETGLVGLRNGPQSLALAPPFPVPENRIGEPWDQQPLLALLDADHTIGVVLLRLGRFSAAVFQGRKLLSSKTDSRYVKGRHSRRRHLSKTVFPDSRGADSKHLRLGLPGDGGAVHAIRRRFGLHRARWRKLHAERLPEVLSVLAAPPEDTPGKAPERQRPQAGHPGKGRGDAVGQPGMAPGLVIGRDATGVNSGSQRGCDE